MVVVEGSLRRHRTYLKNLGVKPSIMYVLLGIVDTLLAYARIQTEYHGKRLRDVRSRLPLNGVYRSRLVPLRSHSPGEQTLVVKGFIQDR